MCYGWYKIEGKGRLDTGGIRTRRSHDHEHETCVQENNSASGLARSFSGYSIPDYIGPQFLLLCLGHGSSNP